MSITKYILVYVDEVRKLNFFNRFYPSIAELGYEIIIITNRVSFLMFGWRGNKKIHVIHKRWDMIIMSNIPMSRELIDKTLTRKEVSLLFSSVYYEAVEIYETHNIENVFIWGGESTTDLAMKQFAKEYNIKTLFFELANIPQKIFVDPLGTNAKSSIYKNVSLLRYYKTDKGEYEEWKNKYLQLKDKETMPPQSSKRKKLYWFYVIDHLGFKLMSIPFENNNSFYRKLKRKLWQKAPNIEFDKYKLEGGKYLFFPMQVSNDAQLLFNSTINNVQAIEYAYKVAINGGLDLLVKLHPAEYDPSEHKKIFTLQRKMKFKIINYSSINVLKYCKRVITINSTVGLEALILGKPVEFLGKTFYKNLNAQLIKNYITSYLIDVDFFENKNIDKPIIQKILMRI